MFPCSLIKSGVKRRKKEDGQITVVSNSNAKTLRGTEYFEQKVPAALGFTRRWNFLSPRNIFLWFSVAAVSVTWHI